MGLEATRASLIVHTLASTLVVGTNDIMTRQPEIGEIPNAVKDDIKALEKELDAAEVEVARYMAKLHAPILKKREDILAKIEGFWPQALTNCVSTNVYIDDEDHPLLDHLTKIDVQRDVNDPRAAKIEFHFSPNEYINDQVLVKEFKLSPEAGEQSAQFDFATDTVPVKTSIAWKSDDVNLAKKKPTTGNIGTGKEGENGANDGEDAEGLEEEDDDFEPGSFFSSFFENENPQIAGSIGRAIVEDLFPNAVHHYEVPALFDEDDEDEDEDEEDEDEEEDEDDGDKEIDLEEEEKRPSKKPRK